MEPVITEGEAREVLAYEPECQRTRPMKLARYRLTSAVCAAAAALLVIEGANDWWVIAILTYGIVADNA